MATGILGTILSSGVQAAKTKIAQFYSLPAVFSNLDQRLATLARISTLPPDLAGAVIAAQQQLNNLKGNYNATAPDVDRIAQTVTAGTAGAVDTAGIALSAASLLEPVTAIFNSTSQISSSVQQLENAVRGAGYKLAAPGPNWLLIGALAVGAFFLARQMK